MVDTIQPNALALVLIFPVLSTIVVLIRAGFRSWTKQFKWDDALCVIAWALAIASAGVTYRFIKINYIGYHIWDIPERSVDDVVYMLKLDMVQQLLYNPSRSLVKASIMIFLLRLGDERRWIRYSLAVFFIFNLGHMVAVFIGVLIQCLPLAMYWDHPHTDQVINGEIYNPHYSCINTEAFFMSTASISILTDLFTLIIPIFLVWPLNLKRHRKFAVGAVLSLGWIVLIVSLIRLKKFYDLWNAPSPDPTYSLGATISVVEVNVAIILCCGPTINAMVTRFGPRLFTSRGTTGPGWDITVVPPGFEVRTRQSKRFSLPMVNSPLTPHRSSFRSGHRSSYRVMEDDKDAEMNIMNNDLPSTWRLDVMRAMNDEEGVHICKARNVLGANIPVVGACTPCEAIRKNDEQGVAELKAHLG